MDYLEWNKRLNDYFFHDDMKDREVFLNVTREILDEIMGEVCEAEDPGLALDPVTDYLKAVAKDLGKTSLYERIRNLDADWGRRNNTCPFIGHLVVCVLVFTLRQGDEAYRANDYYHRLADLLQKGGHSGNVGNNDATNRAVEYAWRHLEEWSATNDNKEFGFYKFRSIGGMAYVGIPRAQALISPVDRWRFHQFVFSRHYSRDNFPRKMDFEIALKTYADERHLSRLTLGLLKSEDAQAASVLVDALHAEAKHIIENPRPRIVQPRLSRDDAAAPDRAHKLRLGITHDFDRGTDVACCFLLSDIPDEEVFLMDGAAKPIHGSFFGSYTLPNDTFVRLFRLDRIPTDFSVQPVFQIKAERGERRAKFARADLHFLEADAGGAWIEITPELLATGGTYRVIARSGAMGVDDFLQKNRPQADHQLAEMPHGWTCHTLRIANLETLGLPIRPERVIQIVGGVRTEAGNARTFFEFAAPFIRVIGQGNPMYLHGNESRSLPKHQNLNEYLIPDEVLQDCRDLVLQVGSEGGAPTGRQERLQFFPASAKPGVRLWDDDASTRCPIFIPHCEGLNLSFDGGRLLGGAGHSFQKDHLPYVVLFNLPDDVETGRIKLLCNGKELEAGQNCRWGLPPLEDGAYKVRAIWHGAELAEPIDFTVHSVPPVDDVVIPGGTRLTRTSHASHDDWFCPAPATGKILPGASQLRVHVDGRKVTAEANGLFPLPDSIFTEAGATVHITYRSLRLLERVLRVLKPPACRHSLCDGRQIMGSICQYEVETPPQVEVFTDDPGGDMDGITILAGGVKCPPIPETQGRFMLPGVTGKHRLQIFWRGMPITSNGPENVDLVPAPIVDIKIDPANSLGREGRQFLNKKPPTVEVEVSRADPGLSVVISGRVLDLAPARQFLLPPPWFSEGVNELSVQWNGRGVASAQVEIVSAPRIDVLVLSPFIRGSRVLLGSDLESAGGLRLGVPQAGDGVVIVMNGEHRILTREGTIEYTVGAELLRDGGNEVYAEWHGVKAANRFCFEVWNSITFLGSKAGQYLESSPCDAPDWPVVWIVHKSRGDLSILPCTSADITPPAMGPGSAKSVVKEWKQIIKRAAVPANASLEPDWRALLKAYKEAAR